MGLLLEQPDLLTQVSIPSNLSSYSTVEEITRNGMSFLSRDAFKNAPLDVKLLRQNPAGDK